MPIAEDSAGGSPVPVPTDLTTNLTGQATGSGTLDYTTGDIDIVVTVVDNGHNHILDNITDVQVNNAISGQVLKYNGNVWVNGTDENAGITAIVQDLTPQLGGNLDLNNRNITGTGNIAITGTIDGRDVSVDGTKLDGIESGATADQTAAQIKTAYESNSNTNAFTDADHTKLDGIETAADVTDTTNVVASLTAGTNVTIAADGTISATGGSSGLAHVVDDLTPELGGNLSLNSHDITGTGNLNFTGSVTLSGTVDGRDVAADGTKLDGIEASADVTDTANVTAAGALMDSEVTNLAQVKAFDSSDYATAAQGTTADAALPKAGGTMTGDILFNDGVKAKYGTSSDLEIYHDTNNSWIRETGTGNLNIGGDNEVRIMGNSGSEFMGRFIANGNVNLYHNNNLKFQTLSTGINVTGNVVGDGLTIAGDATFTGGGTGSIVINDEDSSLCPTMTFTRNGGGTTTNDFIKFENSGGEVATINSTGGALLSKVNVNTSGASNTSNGLAIATSGTNFESDGGIISIDHAASGAVTGGYFSKYSAGGTLRHSIKGDGKGYFAGGIDVTGNIDMPDSSYIAMGTSDDLQIVHTGGNSWIRDVGTGALFLDTNTAIHLYANGTENMLYAQPNAGVQVFYDNVKKLETTSTGIDVTGAVRCVVTSNPGWDTNTRFWGEAGFGARYDSYQHRFDVGVSRTEAMRINYLGNLGIGDTNPSQKLTVSGITKSSNGYMFGTQDAYLYGGSNNTATFRIGLSTAYNYLNFTGLGTSGARFSTASGSLNLGSGANNHLTINYLGNVGIGTTAPKARTHIRAGGYATPTLGSVPTNASLYVSPSDTAYGLVVGMDNVAPRTWLQSQHTGGASVAYPLTLQEAGGNVGIGTAAPKTKTQISAGGTLNAPSLGSSSANAPLYLTNNDTNYGLVVGNNSADGHVWLQAQRTDGTATAYNMTLNEAGGNVGIGTSSASKKLDVRGAANADVGIQVKASGTGDVDAELRLDAADGGEAIVRLARDGVTKARVEFTSNELNITTDASGSHIDLQPDGTRVLRATSSSVDVTGGVSVTTDLSVGFATATGGASIVSHVQSSSTPALATVSGSSLLRTHIRFENANGQVGRINTAGTQTFYVTSSDYRLKTDIQPMQGSIDRVKALNPCNFEWVNDGGRVDGFIAHEVQDVVPEAIVGEKDAMQDQEYVESEATGDIYTPAVKATYETIQVELTPAVEAVYETVTVEISPAVDAVYETITVVISPAVEATYDDDGNELTPAVEAITEEQEQLVTPAIEAVTEEQVQLVTPAVDATYEEQQQELTPAVDEVIHSSDVVEPDELEEGQRWRETTEKVMATRQVPDYQGIDQSKIVPLLTSALQDAIAKIEALETRLEALES